MAYNQAGIDNPLQMVDFAEIDDIYAYKELQALEALRFCRPGEAGDLTRMDLPRLKVISRSTFRVAHWDGVTCWMPPGWHAPSKSCSNCGGEAGARQLEDVHVGLAQSWRGVPTTSGAVAIFSD